MIISDERAWDSYRNSNFTWKVQCRMELMRDGVWGIAAKTEVSQSPEKA